jgi:hypothetical protein
MGALARGQEGLAFPDAAGHRNVAIGAPMKRVVGKGLPKRAEIMVARPFTSSDEVML